MPTKTNTSAAADVDERTALAHRLAEIEARATGRARDIADLEGRRLAAVVDGAQPDEQLATAAVLVDAQALDKLATEQLRSKIADLDAAAARERQLVELEQIRRRLAEQIAQDQVTADSIPMKLATAAAALQAAAEEVRGLLGSLRIGAAAAGHLRDTEQAQALALGVPSQTPILPDQIERLLSSAPLGSPGVRAMNGLRHGTSLVAVAADIAAVATERPEVRPENPVQGWAGMTPAERAAELQAVDERNGRSPGGLHVLAGL